MTSLGASLCGLVAQELRHWRSETERGWLPPSPRPSSQRRAARHPRSTSDEGGVNAAVLAVAVGVVFFVVLLVSVPRVMRGRDSPPKVSWWVLLPTLALVLLINWLAG